MKVPWRSWVSEIFPSSAQKPESGKGSKEGWRQGEATEEGGRAKGVLRGWEMPKAGVGWDARKVGRHGPAEEVWVCARDRHAMMMCARVLMGVSSSEHLDGGRREVGPSLDPGNPGRKGRPPPGGRAGVVTLARLGGEEPGQGCTVANDP
jgi:hypothetical protein